jgi:protein-L-isoaspartate O-methyltransferase
MTTFVLVAYRLRGDAYADRPLPISYGQTISQRCVLVRVVEQSRHDALARSLSTETANLQ